MHSNQTQEYKESVKLKERFELYEFFFIKLVL